MQILGTCSDASEHVPKKLTKKTSNQLLLFEYNDA